MLSDRYVTGRFLPDKAIDLIDEAASKLRIEIDSMPTELDQISRRIRQLEIEKLALAKETDEASKERLERLELELAELGERRDSMAAHWQQEKSYLNAVASCRRRRRSRRRRRPGWSATPTWPARRPSATASCRSWNAASPTPTTTWPSCRPARAS